MNEEIKKGKFQLTLSVIFFILSNILLISMVTLMRGDNLNFVLKYNYLFTFLQLFFGLGWLFFLFSGLNLYRRGKVKEKYSTEKSTGSG